ncbi:sigma-54 dependent transcriptional regulator [bacterium]|nr:sigma-54 dependent transcriptional regulator [bacterium]MBU1984104.1 sigma-54 dependent transcriptional regulator [bacterium]
MPEPTQREVILVVDDNPDTVEVLDRNLSRQGYQVFTAASAASALDVLTATPIDLVITDHKMPGTSGLDLIRHVRDNFRDTEVMMITGYASVQNAVAAVKTGAEEYLAKPFTDDELLEAIGRVLRKLRQRRARYRISEIADLPQFGLIGISDVMMRVIRTLKKAASTKSTVLIAGESGTGKELVARAIHYCSSRAAGPFVPINCGGIPEGLLESELFGHVKGAFTGATESRAGFFQTAEGGSIFFDEISELSLALQVKLLRVLQDNEVCMVGANRATTVDVKILAATNKDLAALVQKGAFREDLYFRLNIITLAVPPLRERGDDVLLLVQYFARKFAKEFEKRVPQFSERAVQALKAYDWPGNVRELENIIHRVIIMSDGDTVDVADLPSLMRYSAARTYSLDRTLADVEAEHIRRVVVGQKGNKSAAAKILGIDRKTLREKMKQFGIS